RVKSICEEDSILATRNLLEKLRKTKRKAQDDCCSKEAVDLLPPTPAIPSVFPFHNAADPEDIIHAQKEQQQQLQQQQQQQHQQQQQQQQQSCLYGNSGPNSVASLTIKDSPMTANSGSYANSLTNTPNATPTNASMGNNLGPASGFQVNFA
ncbi:hypothetical protein KR067_009079, partial [Drosophila pandora]